MEDLFLQSFFQVWDTGQEIPPIPQVEKTGFNVRSFDRTHPSE